MDNEVSTAVPTAESTTSTSPPETTKAKTEIVEELQVFVSLMVAHALVGYRAKDCDPVVRRHDIPAGVVTTLERLRWVFAEHVEQGLAIALEQWGKTPKGKKYEPPMVAKAAKAPKKPLPAPTKPVSRRVEAAKPAKPVAPTLSEGKQGAML